MGTIIGGLPLNTEFCSYRDILLYLLVLLLIDTVPGIFAAELSLHRNDFTLLRSGWKNWMRSLFLRTELVSLGLCVLLFPLAYFTGSDTDFFAVWGLFTLYALCCGGIQSFLLVCFPNTNYSYISLILLQLCSVFLSKYVPGQWKLLFFGNWGCYNRSIPLVEDGISLLGAVGLNLCTLLIILLVGWRLVRYIHRKEPL